MNTRGREVLRGYLLGLAISVGLSLPFSFFIPVQGVSPLVLALLYGMPFALALPTLSMFILPRLRQRSYLLTLVLSSLVVGLTLYSILGFITWFVLALGSRSAVLDPDVMAAAFRALTHPILVGSLGLAFVLHVVVTAMNNISRKLGPGVMRNWVMGYYHEPREEERIFMFVDLKDSTTHAENLGNLAFSSLVRDFLGDLTEPVMASQGEVSHYIGDEAVLSWTLPRGLAQGNCVRCFFLLEDRLESRRDYYLRRYGFVPEFKAGAHLGQVVATEVGEIKSEIVYHGDVLNTAARIQGLCGVLGAALLVSRALADRLPEVPTWRLTSHGPQDLKGKELPVEVVEIERLTPHVLTPAPAVVATG